MVRVEPLEKALPSDWRRVVRDQPLLSLVAALAAGIYLGKHHGKQLFSALVSMGIAAAVSGARKRIAP
jgi:hypothetical protein